MNIEVELPDLGDDSGDEATVSEWRYEEGDYVEKGEALVEIVTIQDTLDVPCPESGTLVARLVEENDLVRVGDLLAVIEAADQEEPADAEE